jgi:hypothetical protein
VAIRDHLRALEASPEGHAIVYFNAHFPVPGWLKGMPFDAVLLHTTLLCMRWSEIFPSWSRRLDWLAGLSCVKAAIPQDEYDHSQVLDEWLARLGVTDVFSCLHPRHWPLLYPTLHGRARFHRCLTAYIDGGAAERWRPRLLPLARRPVDIVYRATRLPFHFGSQGQLKHQIAERVAEAAARHGLSTDISTRPEDTILGDAWYGFLARGRAVIGCESGSSVLDRRGEVAARIREILSENPHLDFSEVSRRMPEGWDSHRFFALSARHLEAVVTRTCQVLVEGEYDGVLLPDVHYIPLARDFSNLDEVMERLRDHARMQEMADRAYEDLYLRGDFTFRRLARQFDQALGRSHPPPGLLARLAAWASRHRPWGLHEPAPLDLFPGGRWPSSEDGFCRRLRRRLVALPPGRWLDQRLFKPFHRWWEARRLERWQR